VVTAANNHGGDYGPVSVEDTARWCETAGLVCVGIGRNRREAETPRVVCAGPIQLAVAGMDATKPHFRADDDRPGTSYSPEDENLEAFADKIGRLAKWADGRCDLLVLTIHWGPNWADTPSPARRAMARIAFENGVDLILGHSAHRLQGIEIIGGKPVLYDMGNLLFDCELKPEGRRSALFRLRASPEGVHRIEIVPAQALHGRTVLAGTSDAHETLSELGGLCADLGTELSIDEDLEGRPIGVINIPEPRATPRKRPDSPIASAVIPAHDAVLPTSVDEAILEGKVPEDARSLIPPAALAPGVELLGYRLPDTAIEGRILRLSTWWRVSRVVGRNVMLAFHLSPQGETPRRGTPWYTRHDAGDWTVPLHLVKPGSILEDHYPCRLAGLPPGPCKIYALVIDTSRSEKDRILGKPQLLGELEIQPTPTK
jgi:hypothetical protein